MNTGYKYTFISKKMWVWKEFYECHTVSSSTQLFNNQLFCMPSHCMPYRVPHFGKIGSPHSVRGYRLLERQLREFKLNSKNSGNR